VTGAPLQIVHTWQLKASQIEGATASFWEASTGDARARATQWVLAALGPNDAARWTLHILEGSPGPVLVEYSKGASLLVLGTGAHTGIRRLLAGSVSHYALSHALPPVVAVRAVTTGTKPSESSQRAHVPPAPLPFP
jgi:nucleotide-binding universal stress UspA family protein